MRDLHNTLVNITNEHMGSQSVLFEGTHDIVCVHNGTPFRQFYYIYQIQ